MNIPALRNSLLVALFFLISPLWGQENSMQSHAQLQSLWENVDSLENEGLTLSASQVVDSLYELAVDEQAAFHQVKAIVYQMKYRDILEENSEQQNIQQLTQAAARADFPARPIMQAFLADLYWKYYQYNRWSILERSPTQMEPEDFLTWDARRFIDKISDLYLTSLSQAEALQGIPVQDASLLLVQAAGSPSYRPTLYDLLAHKALTFFTNSESFLTQPQTPFHLPANQAFLPARQFVEVGFTSPDSTDRLFQATRVFQSLLAFHLERLPASTDALLDLELKRFAFAHEHAQGIQKEDLYKRALENTAQAYAEHPIAAEFLYQLASIYHQAGEQYDPLVSEEYRWLKKQALEICERVLDQYPGSEGANRCLRLQATIQDKAMELKIEEVNLPDLPSRLSFTYKNLSQVYFRIVKAPKSVPEGGDRQAFLRLLTTREAVHAWEVTLPDQEDYQSHRIELPVTALAPGAYFILAADGESMDVNESAVSYTAFQVSNLAYFYRMSSEDGHLDFQVVDRNLSKPLGGVKVQTYVYDYDTRTYEAQGSPRQTDKNGWVALENGESNNQFEVELTAKDDRLRSGRLYAYYYYPQERELPRERTHFFTDRKIYRPGQTIYFKGIVLEESGKTFVLKKNESVTVRLFDVNGEEVESQELRSNDFGTFSGTFAAPTGRLLGNMSIRTETGGISVSVEEYKRPSFEVSLDVPEGTYQLDDTVNVGGMAQAYAGNPIIEGEVRYRVVRSANFPFWYSMYRWLPVPYSQEKEIASGTVMTGEDGAFSFSFPLIPDSDLPKARKPIFSYNITVDVTDITGETHSASSGVRAGYVPFEFVLDLPEQMDAQEPDSLRLVATNLAGGPASVKGVLKITRLKPPLRILRDRRWERPDLHQMDEYSFRQQFPYDVYDQENELRTWEEEAVLFERPMVVEESKTLPLPMLNGAPQGLYKISMDIEDAEVSVQHFLYLRNHTSKSPVIPQVLETFLDKETAEPGETVHYQIRTSEKKIWAWVELQQNGEVLSRELFKLKGKKPLDYQIDIQEKHRGNLVLLVTTVAHNQFYQASEVVRVPWTNKELALEWSTFRSELQPGESDQWKLTLKGPKGEKVAAEMVATLYDASLDIFRLNSWGMYLYPSYSQVSRWNGSNGFGTEGSYLFSLAWQRDLPRIRFREYDQFNGFGFLDTGVGRYQLRSRDYSMAAGYAEADGATFMAMEEMQAEAPVPGEMGEAFRKGAATDTVPLSEKSEDTDSPEIDEVPLRTNFNETAFFFPHLQTNAAGEVILDFTIPEALTRWKFLGLAHTEDLKVGSLTGTVVTKKKLMVQPNLPRFVRPKDEVTFTAKVSNLTEQDLGGAAEIRILDAQTLNPVDQDFQFRHAKQSLFVKAGRSEVLSWTFNIPEGYQALVIQVMAQAEGFSDGEEHLIPILPAQMLVKESLPITAQANSKETLTWDRMAEASASSTLKPHRLTLEFTSHPVWYAVQALPYLMEFPYECTEQIFSRYYAHSLAGHIVAEQPAIEKVYQQWRQAATMGEGASLLSNLEKNQELKQLILEETPWVMEAREEGARKRRIAMLFDVNTLAESQARALRQLKERQYTNGGFSWFPGMPASRYITQLITTGMGHLQHLGLDNLSGNAEMQSLTQEAVPYLDRELANDFSRLKQYAEDLKEDHLGPMQVQYLYMRSFFDDIPMTEGSEAAYTYYLDQARKYWLNRSTYLKGMLALVFFRAEDQILANRILRSIGENAVRSKEMGMYWKDNLPGYVWYEAPIERQALLIEAFDEIAQDQARVDEMKTWLLRHKQTNNWETTRATVAACNALLLTGGNSLAGQQPVSLTLGGQKVSESGADAPIEAGSGYFKQTWLAAEIEPDMAKIEVDNPNDHMAWGALHWQYFEDLDKISAATSPLNIKKSLFVETLTDKGPELLSWEANQKVTPGDKVVVRLEVRTDRDMEYVHIKDMRGAGLEPVQPVSRYQYKQGLGYYESPRDAGMHFFIEFLPKGTYVLEYSLRANLAGTFSNGISSIQCMYAPEFNAHTAGKRIVIDKE